MKTKHKILLTLIFLLIGFNSFGQTILFSEDFETSPSEGLIPHASSRMGWKVYENIFNTYNDWGISNDAGAISGYSLSVAENYSGVSYFYYWEDTPTDLVAYYGTKIDASLYGTLTLDFDWKCTDGSITDYMKAVWSTDGTTWNDVSATKYFGQATTQNVINLDLSAADGQQFYIGFRWINANGSVNLSKAIGIDNIVVKGTIASNTTLTIDPVSAAAGTAVAVPILAADISGLIGFQWSIDYDETKLTYVDCIWDSQVNGDVTIYNYTTTGVLTFAHSNGGNIANEIDIASGKFFDINFTINSGASGDACLTWEDSPTPRELSDINENIITPVTWENGCVTILPPPPSLIIDNTILGTEGNPVTVPINALNITDLVGFQWTIDYDETKLTYVDCDSWHSDVNGTVTIFDNGDKLTFAHSNGGTAADEINIADDVFFNINFTVNAGATGDACLTWEDSPTPRELSDINENIITPITWENGCVTIVLEGYWTGSVSTEWDNTGNWSDFHIPISGDDAIIPDVSGGSNRFPYIDVAAVCANLTIDAGANIQIAPDYSLTVENTLTNNGGVDGLVVKSDATGSGSLKHNTADVDGTVEVFFEAADAQWHFLSSPVIDGARSLFTPQNFYYYDESTADYWDGADNYDGTTGWTNPATNMETMKGYIYYYNQTTLEYEGKLHYDASGYNINVTYNTHTGGMTGDGTYGSWSVYDGWNLIGNPYPCAVDWDYVVTNSGLTNVNNTLYFYDDNTDNYRYYNTNSYDNGTIGANNATRYIPVGQGFFVKTDNSGGGNVKMDIAARVHNTQDFYKGENNKQLTNYLKLSTNANGVSDELIIRSLPTATYNFDGEFDAYKRYSWNNQVPQIYTMNSQKNTEYAINTLPQFDNTISIPLGFSIDASDSYYFELSEMKFDYNEVYIEDTYLGTNQKLLESETYYFDFEGGNNRDRFILHLVKGNQLNVDAISDVNVSVYPNPTKSIVNLSISKLEEGCNYFVTDAIGRIILQNNISSYKTEIDLSEFASGVYVIGINIDGKIIKKVIIKE